MLDLLPGAWPPPEECPGSAYPHARAAGQITAATAYGRSACSPSVLIWGTLMSGACTGGMAIASTGGMAPASTGGMASASTGGMASASTGGMAPGPAPGGTSPMADPALATSASPKSASDGEGLAAG